MDTNRELTVCLVHYVGVDLAWGQRSPTGVAVLDASGTLCHVNVAVDDDDVLSQLDPYLAGDCVVAIDAPLLVTNPSGNRPCEAALNRDFRRFDAGTHPANTGLAWFADGGRGARLCAALDLDLDPRSTAPRKALEVYPHAASVVLFGLDKTLKYKQKQGRDFPGLRSELLRLMDFIEELADLTVATSKDWGALRTAVDEATRKSQLRRAEDPVDAVLCAYIARFATRRPQDVTIYGDTDTGCIVTPTIKPTLSTSRSDR
jgi:predicted RNase H-like nuclease